MGFLGEVEDAVGEHFPGEVQPVQVPLGPAGGDIAPGLLRVQPHQAGEAGDDLPFDAVGVAPVVAAVEGVPDVVQRVFEEGQEGRVVELLVGGVPDLLVRCGLDFGQETVQSFLGIRLRPNGRRVQVGHSCGLPVTSPPGSGLPVAISVGAWLGMVASPGASPAG